jgi:hypothetical protein
VHLLVQRLDSPSGNLEHTQSSIERVGLLFQSGFVWASCTQAGAVTADPNCTACKRPSSVSGQSVDPILSPSSDQVTIEQHRTRLDVQPVAVRPYRPRDGSTLNRQSLPIRCCFGLSYMHVFSQLSILVLSVCSCIGKRNTASSSTYSPLALLEVQESNAISIARPRPRYFFIWV